MVLGRFKKQKRNAQFQPSFFTQIFAYYNNQGLTPDSLRKPLQNKRRVHVGGSFVLIYEINKDEKIVTLLDLDHHDNIYKT